MEKQYYLSRIYTTMTADTGLSFNEYKVAFDNALLLMIRDETIAAVLIYSNIGTAIVINRKRLKT